MAPGSEKAFNQLFDFYMALKKEDIQFCNQPIEIAVAEAAQLALASMEDRADLAQTGLDMGLVDSLSTRAGGLAYAAARYQMAIEQDPEAARLWKAESPAGYEVRKYLLKFMSLAFRNEETLLKQLERIKEGRGHRDMIVDLLSLSILGEENAALLAQIPMFDREKVAEARTLNNRLEDLLAKTTLNPEAINESKNIFHRAWTYYKQAADEVKVHGQFLYEGTDRYDRYVSTYFQNSGKTSGEIKVDKTAEV